MRYPVNSAQVLGKVGGVVAYAILEKMEDWALKGWEDQEGLSRIPGRETPMFKDMKGK